MPSRRALTTFTPIHVAISLVVCAVAALYFNVFVLVVQLFLKAPALKALAPTQSEAPFALAQGSLLVFAVTLGVLAVRGFRDRSAAGA